jgi:hypothetical protein
LCTAPNPRVRRESASNPFMPPRRSNRACVAKKGTEGGPSEMPRAEEADESKTEDEYIPGNSPTFGLLLKFGFGWVPC